MPGLHLLWVQLGWVIGSSQWWLNWQSNPELQGSSKAFLTSPFARRSAMEPAVQLKISSPGGVSMATAGAS